MFVDQGPVKEKRARLVATRPEPTIIGNCDGWGFIVGKLAHSHSPQLARQVIASMQVEIDEQLIHKTIRTPLNNLWTVCGSSVEGPLKYHFMVTNLLDMPRT